MASEPDRDDTGDISGDLGSPLDTIQLRRIEAVHRGFLYQHLYAAACLLTRGRIAGNVVVVERDEDIELIARPIRHYIQVKTRSRPLQLGDINDVLDRFKTLRQEHRSGKRNGEPEFVIVANVPLGPDLAALLTNREWPNDVAVITPDRPREGPLPPAWPDLDSAIKWCREVASTVPFGALAPETLVWKLAARVQYAAAGAGGHRFNADQLPVLLEQLLVQLQDFPDPPAQYRPQIDEPALTSDARVRLLTGFSGAGKTAWASQAALHSSEAVAYYDVGDMPAASVANALARELVARFAGGRERGLGGGILSEKSGVDVLRACAAYLEREHIKVTVVIDNVQRMSADAVRTIIDAAPTLRFLLIGQPWDGKARVEAVFVIESESLAGWSNDSIAAEFNRENSPISVETAQRVSRLTGGLPLYVRNAASLTATNYGRDGEAFCAAIEARTHTKETAQEIILGEVFGRLDESVRRAAAILSYCDVPLTNIESIELLSDEKDSEAAAAQSLRMLRRASIIVGFQGDRTALHDALRPLAIGARNDLPAGIDDAVLRRLSEILMRSLPKERNIPRLNALLRLLPRIGKSDVLVDLATHDMFHELGDQRALRDELEKVAVDSDGTPSDQYWANDALAYWESRDGGRPAKTRLATMHDLIAQGNLGINEQLGLCFKELAAAGFDDDRAEIERVYEKGKRLTKNNQLTLRLLRYNYAIALHRTDSHRDVLEVLEPLISEYYRVIGITEADVFMKSNAQLQGLLRKNIDPYDVKRLADTLSLWCITRVTLNLPPMLRRIHAAKFYALANAGRSAATTGQESVDDFLQIYADPVGAREVMEKHVLPVLPAFGLTDLIVPIRSHYAIVLAWCGEVDAARQELKALSEYRGDREQRDMLAERARFVEAIATGAVRLQRKIPSPNALQAIPGAKAFLRKIGRNYPCPCGSGRKYKRCHGSN